MCRYCERETVDSIVWLEERGIECEGFDLPEGEDGDEAPEADEEGDEEPGGEEDGDEDEAPDEIDFCERAAKFLVHTRTVADHLCDACAQKAQARLRDGEASMLQEVRLADQHEFLRLEPGEIEVCEQCGAPATCAQVVGLAEHLCREHAEAEGATIPPRPKR